ncbi:MAG: serine hydrolase domain-containing protein [Sphingosinicella sp.]|uniref:serine hydrolase domain-containing protein n=1 Tax=Sphingosinicella sp. TaxID=1917971 RepID=UPI004037CE7E
MRWLAFLASLWLTVDPAAGASGRRIDAATIASVVDPLIEAELRTTGMPGAAFIFVRDGRVVYRRGYGFADAAAGVPADPNRTVWPIASITKVVTAIAALQLVAPGRIGLDEDINPHLRRVLAPADPQVPMTLRHLLSHRTGLDELPGRQFDGASRPDMATFLNTRLRRYRAPGRATAYSTYGIMLAGLLVEELSGTPYETYVTDNILRPLGMSRSRFMIRRGDERGIAQGYELDDVQARPVPHEFYVSAPASSMVATADDMGRLLLTLLDEGRTPRGGRLLPAPLVRAMFEQQVTIHPALPGWGLGMQLDLANGVRIAEHGGDIGGFSALFVLFPDENAGFFIVNHGEGSDLRFRVRQALLDRFWPGAPRPVPQARPEDAPRLAQYGGRYLSSLACRSCPEAAGQVFILTAAEDGTLRFWGQRWLPLGEDLFVRDDGQRLLGFSRHADGRIASISGGSWRVADRID